jgi:hypothetical protein
MFKRIIKGVGLAVLTLLVAAIGTPGRAIA